MENTNIITVCAGCFDSNSTIIKCGKIKVDEGIWRTEEEVARENPLLYSQYLTAIKDKRLSHGYCPTCYQITISGLELSEQEESAKKSNHLEQKANSEIWPLEMPLEFIR
jgi:hypothetical protein